MKLVQLIILIILLFKLDFDANGNDLASMKFVDLHKYAGTWYEVAHLPNCFQQRRCIKPKFVYKFLSNERISIDRECFDEASGIKKKYKGEARVLQDGTNAKWKIWYPNVFSKILPKKWFEGNYWIIDLDEEDYQYAILGEPSKIFLWILARDPAVDEKKVDYLLSRALEKGYRIKSLVKKY